MLSAGARVFTRPPSAPLFPTSVTPKDRETWQDPKVEVKIIFRTSEHRNILYTTWQKKKCVSIHLRAFISFFFLSTFCCSCFICSFSFVQLFRYALFLLPCSVHTSLLCLSSPLRTLLNPQTGAKNSARFVFSTLRFMQPAYHRCRRGCLTVTANFRSAPSSAAVATRDKSSIYTRAFCHLWYI